MLMCLVFCQRGQTIRMLNLESQIAFVLSKRIKKLNQVLTTLYVWSLQEYLTRTEVLRGHWKQFFISYLKFFHPVSRSTISRWLKEVIKAAGTNVAKVKP